MASKTHVDSTVNERRLRPIYDWLDIGNNKKALQEADKVLRKHSGNQCARVLKALALLRLGKEDECQAIMDKVRSEVPCEDSTLQAMSICYREIHQPDKISELYEAAAKAEPYNEELLTHLFMSYVRLGDYKKQQQTALTLYKLKPKNPYYFWAVMSAVMQAIQADEKLARSVILPLAERMVLKVVNEGKMYAEQEVQLYLMILDLQEKNEEILNVLSGPLAKHLSCVMSRKAAVYKKLERFPEAVHAYQKLIEEDMDNWAYYKDYLSTALNLQSPAECLEFFNRIATTSDRKVRSPHLAKFELLRRIGEEADGLKLLEPVGLMRDYFAKFGDKGCVVGDLRFYLDLLTPTGKLQLLQKIEEDVGVQPDGFPTTVNQMQRHIHLEQLKRICGFHHAPMADKNKRKELAGRLCDLYNKGNELCPVEERLPTDFCPADSYIIMAAHVLHQLYAETGDASYLYIAIVCLEPGLLSSPANFHIKILLVRIYLEVGLVGVADQVFALLDVKHIQLDSLGYLHTPLLAPYGHLLFALAMLDNTAKFFLSNVKDSADHVTFAYKYGSFQKIQEFVEMRERLENSLHFATTTVDKMLLELSWCDTPTAVLSTLTHMHVQPQEDSIRWDRLRDNRDLDVVVGWEPLTLMEDIKRKQEATRTCMLRLLAGRNLILRIVAATAEPETSSLLARLSEDLKDLDAEICAVLAIFGPVDSACHLLVPMDAVERLREAHVSEQFATIASFAKSLSNSLCPNDDCLQILKNAPCLKTRPLRDKDKPMSYKHVILRATTCSETLTIISAICIMCASQLPQQTTQKKSKKKFGKVIETVGQDASEGWKQIASLIADRAQALESFLDELEKIEVQTGLNSEDEVPVKITKAAEACIAQACRSLKSRAQLTLKLVNDLKKT